MKINENHIFLLFAFITISLQCKAQYNMDNTPVNSCSGIFYDSGGSGTNIGATYTCIVQGSYSNNEDYIKKICSNNGENLFFTFNEIDIVGSDYLMVYDGDTTTAPLIATLDSSSVATTFISSSTCLTFKFHSGDNGTTGWLNGDCDNGGNWSASFHCLQQVIITDTLVNTCSALFIDDGGLNNSYSNNVNSTITFCSSNSNCLNLNFLELDLGQGDQLTFYSGSSTLGSPLITLDQNTIFPIQTIIPINETCLTAQFTSDSIGVGQGWKAYLECTQLCELIPECGSNSPPTDQCIDATQIFYSDPICANTSNYTCFDQNGVDWDDVPGLVFCGSIENESWLTFIANDTVAKIKVWTQNCQNNDGIQISVYSTIDCQNFVQYSNCVSVGLPTNFLVTASNLTLGNTYYILIDGFAGDICDYVILLESGISNNETILSTNIPIELYPNPFSDKAILHYEIMQPSNVLIEIFNLYGDKIQTIFQNKMDIGIYNTEINIYSDGIYFIKLSIDKKSNFIKAIKMN